MSVWGELLSALIGLGALGTGILGLALGGNLPGIRVPRHLRRWAMFFHTLVLIVGLTLVTAAPPDLVERLWNQLTG